MKTEKEKKLGDNDPPNYQKLLPITVEFERLDTSFYDVLRYFRPEGLIYKREPNTPSGVAKYLIYVSTDFSPIRQEEYLGYVLLMRNTANLTTAEIQYLGNEPYQKLFEKLLESWHKQYKIYATIEEAVNLRPGVSKNSESDQQKINVSQDSADEEIAPEYQEKMMFILKACVDWVDRPEILKDVEEFLGNRFGRQNGLLEVGKAKFYRSYLPTARRYGLIKKGVNNKYILAFPTRTEAYKRINKIIKGEK